MGIRKRKKYKLPPFVNLISIIIENNNPSIAKKHAYETISFLKKVSNQWYSVLLQPQYSN